MIIRRYFAEELTSKEEMVNKRLKKISVAATTILVVLCLGTMVFEYEIPFWCEMTYLIIEIVYILYEKVAMKGKE